MLTMIEGLEHFVGTIAVVALLAIAYGSLQRWLSRDGLSNLLLGTLFGLGAGLAIVDPITLQSGVTIDVGAVPVALAAVYLLPAGAVLALAIAISARLWIGGTGVVPGVAGLCMTFGVSLILGRLYGSAGSRSFRHLAVLSLACSAGLGGLLLLPWPIAQDYLLRFGPLLVLGNAAGFLLAAMIFERELRLFSRETGLLVESQTDPLTRLLNRRGFEAAYARVASDRRRQWGSALLMLDLDHFKALNDKHGHHVGDLVLQEVARRLGTTLRQSDLISRVGGEELAAHMTGLTRDQAADAARRLCHDIGRQPVVMPSGEQVRVTVSIGVHWTDVQVELATALSLADAALYAAKREGRDRFVMAA